MIRPPRNVEGIPKGDLPDFLALPHEARELVKARLCAVLRLRGNGARGIGARIAAEAERLAISAKRLRWFYDAYRDEGWRALIDRRQWPQCESHLQLLPDDVVALFTRLCWQYGSALPAHRKLLELWQAGEPQGLTWPAVDESTGLPGGCTYRNLQRHAPPTDGLMAAVKNLRAEVKRARKDRRALQPAREALAALLVEVDAALCAP